MCGGGL
ncbi:hypothetical protein LINPERPRIM_LOCUS11433 [Linum perenne]